ncbi:MAG TPA: transporter substrate-binding domain-containing protein [Beijerinckiaceae bacterium]|nr:transporter substrate-binding domain-containing protein [Beijerinckiaceae bacterium]
MPDLKSRRHVVSGVAALSFAAASRKAWPQTKDQGTLARLRAAKSVTVGVANFPPYSGIDPDGTLTGVAPALTKVIMTRLGVPDIKGISAGYGELIPGMQAGRWEFICAALTITKARCAQALYCDPIVFDGGSFVWLKGALDPVPKLVSDLVARKLIVGTSAGGAIARLALEAGVDPANLKQFPDNVSIIDGLVAKRIQVAFQDNSSISRVYKQRGLAVDVTFPVDDSPEHGSGCAFRPTDTDLHSAFQQELRAMKASGEYLAIARQYGFDTPPELMTITAEQACATST